MSSFSCATMFVERVANFRWIEVGGKEADKRVFWCHEQHGHASASGVWRAHVLARRDALNLKILSPMGLIRSGFREDGSRGRDPSPSRFLFGGVRRDAQPPSSSHLRLPKKRRKIAASCGYILKNLMSS